MEIEIIENNPSLKQRTGFGPAALVLGIISVLSCFFWYLTLPTGVLAIVFGTKGTKRTGSKLAKAGLILGIIGLSLFVLVYAAMISGIVYFY